MTLKTVSNVAGRIIDLVGKASSREREPSYKDYAAVLWNAQEVVNEAVIAGKRIDADSIRKIINEARNPESLLRLPGIRDVPQPSRGLNRLEAKMDKGGLSLGNIMNAKDLQAVAEIHGLEMLNIYGIESGTERWNHIRTLVQNQCHEAHDEAETADGPYGKQMLMKVRARLKELHEEHKTSLSGCRYEHLLGVASVLTQDCKVWWSVPFSLEGE